MGKIKTKKAGKALGKVVKAVAGATPAGRALKVGGALLKGVGIGGGRGGRRRAKQLTPERLIKKLIQLRMKNKITKEKMKPLSYIK